MGRTVTKKTKKTTIRPRAPGKRMSKPPRRFQNEQAASDNSESDGPVSGPGTRSRSRLAKEVIAEQEKREKRAERNDSSDSLSLLGAAAALERQQEPSEFAKALQKRVALAMQPSETSDSSSASDSDGEGVQMPRTVKVTAAGQQTAVEAARANSVISEEAFAELQRRQLAVEQQTGAILAAVRSLTDSISKRDGDSHSVQQAVHTAPSVVHSDAHASVASSVASSHVSSVSQQRINGWARKSVENVAANPQLTENNLRGHNKRMDAIPAVSDADLGLTAHCLSKLESIARSPPASEVLASSLSDSSSKASSRTVGTQTEAAPTKSKNKNEKKQRQGRKTQTKESSVKKTGGKKVRGPRASKSVGKTKKARKEREEKDDTDPSSSEPDDSSSGSSSDSDAPPPKDRYRKGKKEKVSQKNSRRRATDIKAPTYSGDAYVDQFLKQFRTRARLAGWPKDEWGSRLLISLAGKARGILTTSDLPDEPSFKQLSALLKKRFGSEASSQVWRATLSQRKRGERESLTELAHSIMEAVVKAYPKRDDEARQDLATTYFINALLDEGQQQHINTHEVDTLEQATKLAVAYENARRTTQKRSAPFRPRVHTVEEENSAGSVVRQFSSGQGKGRSQDDQLNKKMDDLAKSVAALATQVNSMIGHAAQQRPQVSVLGRGGPSRNSQWSGGHNNAHQQQRQVSYGPPAAGYTGCFTCEDLSHFSRECPHRFPIQGAGNAQSRSSAEQGAGQASY